MTKQIKKKNDKDEQGNLKDSQDFFIPPEQKQER